ncbi:MAG: nucleotide exchange factor GrpE [Deltaproteobacteria bacterium]
MREQEKENIETEEAAPEKVEEVISATPPLLEAELKRLSECLGEKTREAEANYDKFLRICADLENYKKRAEKEKAELISFSNERLLRELIPVVDNLERAIEHIEEGSDFSAIKDGIRLVLDNLLVVLKKFGVEQISALGTKFDPVKHEAVNQEESAEHGPGVVIKEFHKCYYLNNRLIRPAMVVISKLPEKSAEGES